MFLATLTALACGPRDPAEWTVTREYLDDVGPSVTASLAAVAPADAGLRVVCTDGGLLSVHFQPGPGRDRMDLLRAGFDEGEPQPIELHTEFGVSTIAPGAYGPFVQSLGASRRLVLEHKRLGTRRREVTTFDTSRAHDAIAELGRRGKCGIPLAGGRGPTGGPSSAHAR